MRMIHMPSFLDRVSNEVRLEPLEMTWESYSYDDDVGSCDEALLGLIMYMVG